MPITPAEAMRIVALPMKDWAARVEKMTPDERMALEDTLSSIAIRCTRLATYTGYRNGHRGADNTPGMHDRAVKRQNEAAGKVRGALGFALKRDDITF